MNSCFTMYYISLCFFLFCNTFLTCSAAISYIDHCSSTVPQSTPTHRTQTHSIPYSITPYYSGGHSLMKEFNASYYYPVGKSLRITITDKTYETIAKGIYKVEAILSIKLPSQLRFNAQTNSTYGGSYHPRRSRNRRFRSLRFLLTGFWSESSRKLCMVGSASWQLEQGTKQVDLEAVLKLYYASDDTDMFTSVTSGTLESTSKDFDPISIFEFPHLPFYNFSLLSEELKRGAEVSGDFVGLKDQFLDLQPGMICSTISRRFFFLEMDYSVECMMNPYKCSPVDEFLPRFVSLMPITCYEDERKIRYMVTFSNGSYNAFDHSFSPNSTLVGEGSWDGKNNRLFVIACRILNPGDHFGKGVGDCSTRLSLRFPLVWNIRNSAKVVGRIWTDKTVDDPGYFRNINFTSSNDNDVDYLTGFIYEYTELDRVKNSCPVKKPAKKKGDRYPDGLSYDMRFDMSVENSKGEKFAWGYSTPISVGNELYQRNTMLVAMSPASMVEEEPASDAEFATISYPPKVTNTPLNISYTIFINPFHYTESGEGRMEIRAEGVYDPETGHLCMVGCKKMLSYFQKLTADSLDCEILVNFDFSPMNLNRGGLSKGSIKSTRDKLDPLYFDELSLSSTAFYSDVAKRSIWRMDFEITMVLISNTLICIFIGLQIFHVKKNPEVLSSVSLVMLSILSLGHMIPLVLNFEALFMGNLEKQTLSLSNGRWLEANEVAVRVITMVAFLLQIRLLQLVWTAKPNNVNERGEKKSGFVSLVIYFLGGLVTLLLNWVRNNYQSYNPNDVYRIYSLWGDLRSYLGLILDGFLLPQIMFNVFRGSAEKALCRPFYIGTSAVRLVPHAYDQYRAHNYPSYSNVTYYYANRAGDFYSTAWDIIIPFLVVVLAVMVFLQQRNGGRWILPRRFREVELYEKVPAGNDEQETEN